MSRTLQWNDEYCPNGHRWVFCAASSLYPDFYYCEQEDRFWEPTVKPLKVEAIAKQYNGNRPNQMMLYALSEQVLRDIRYSMNHSEIIALGEQSTGGGKLDTEKEDE